MFTTQEMKTLTYALKLARDRVSVVDPKAFPKPGQDKHVQAWKDVHLNCIASIQTKLEGIQHERDEQAVAGETCRQAPDEG